MEDLIVEELLDYHIKPGFFETYKEAMQGMSDMIATENESQRQSVNIRLSQIEADMKRIREGFMKGFFEAEEAGKMRQALEEEKTTLLSRLNLESKAMDAAYFKTAQHFLETFQILAQKYKTAPSDLKREICDLFFTKRSLVGGKLLFEPSPIMQEVAVIANLSNGRDGGTRTHGLLLPKQAL